MRLKPHQFRFWRGSRRGSAKGQATASRLVAPVKVWAYSQTVCRVAGTGSRNVIDASKNMLNKPFVDKRRNAVGATVIKGVYLKLTEG